MNKNLLKKIGWTFVGVMGVLIIYNFGKKLLPASVQNSVSNLTGL